ncbi:MAG: tyrosine-type recombinase/integrase [Bacteriovoracaceae bacterium]|nr:tyrosine-type recombinase/integrase [Bacteriovoracaceae bacterium]
MILEKMHLLPVGQENSEWKKLLLEFFAQFISPHTRRSYSNDLEHFFYFLKEFYPSHSHPHSLEKIHILAYREWLIKLEQAPKTIARKISSLSSLFAFLTEKGVMEYNLTESIKRPKQTVKTPTQDLNDEQVQNLLAELQKATGPSALLHQAIILTLFTTGMRVGELVALRRKHFLKHQNHYLLQLRAKGGKELTKLLHPVAVAAIEAYLFSRPQDMHPEDFLFTPTRNPVDGNLEKSLDPKSVAYMIKEWCKRAGIHQRISPHSARATYIGSALEQGHDLYKVSKDVGHSSVKTTEEYNKRARQLKDSPIYHLGFLKEKENK